MTSKTWGPLLADTIDEKLLPRSALIDSSVLIPALSDKHRPGDRASGLLYRALVDHKRRVLIAAPTFAEMLRGDRHFTLPRIQGVVVVAFDQTAADVLGRNFSKEILVRFKTETGLVKDWIRYDAMIAACAIRHKAEMLVSTDINQTAIARSAGITVKTPSDFLRRQQDLF